MPIVPQDMRDMMSFPINAPLPTASDMRAHLHGLIDALAEDVLPSFWRMTSGLLHPFVPPYRAPIRPRVPDC